MPLQDFYLVLLTALFRDHQLRIATEELKKLFAELGLDFENPGEEAHHLIVAAPHMAKPEAHVFPLAPMPVMRKVLGSLDRELDEAFVKLERASWQEMVQVRPEDSANQDHEYLAARMRAILSLRKKINARVLPLAEAAQDALLDIRLALQKGPGLAALQVLYDFSQKSLRF